MPQLCIEKMFNEQWSKYAETTARGRVEGVLVNSQPGTNVMDFQQNGVLQS